MRKLLTLLLSLFVFWAEGQDAQVSQYYSAPLYLNPALTGAGDCYRTGLLYRSQWSGLDKPFSTITAYVDLNYTPWSSGFGLLVLRDNAGTNNISTTEVELSYRYDVALDNKNHLRFGLQGGYGNKTINYDGLNFEDQYLGTQIQNQNTIDPVTEANAINFADFSAGLLLFGDDSYWLGLSAHHLNRPVDSFYDDENRLPIKYSIHGGYKIKFSRSMVNRNKAPFLLTPTFMYKHQGMYDQMDLGMYFIQHSILFGLWYRGVLIKEEDNIRNNDALIVHLGYKHNALSLIYSYDATLSNLALGNTKGSHEISLTYDFCLSWPPQTRVPKNVKRLPCPSFLK